MYSLAVLILTALAALLVGGAIGALLGRHLSRDVQKQRDLERSLDKLLRRQKNYQHEVVEHFTDTAQLLHTLANSYRAVHNHLAKGAGELCDDKTGSILRPLPEVPLDKLAEPPVPEGVQPPLDYAPKESPHAAGVLNEAFGLDRHPDTTPEAATDALVTEVAEDAEAETAPR